MKNKMNFFFDYIYFRITQLFFKKQGRTGATAITLISLMQSFMILLVIFEPLKYWITIREGSQFPAQTGKVIIIVVFLLLFFLNYKKYTGKYNVYRFHWKDESRSLRAIKGFMVVIAVSLPLVVYILLNTHFNK